MIFDFLKIGKFKFNTWNPNSNNERHETVSDCNYNSSGNIDHSLPFERATDSLFQITDNTRFDDYSFHHRSGHRSFFIRWLEDKPKLALSSKVVSRQIEEYNSIYYYLDIENTGSISAENCQLKVTIDASKDDVVDAHANSRTFHIMPYNAWRLDDLNVLWNHRGTLVNPPPSLNGKDRVQVEFFRIVKAELVEGHLYQESSGTQLEIPLHFEIPYRSSYKEQNVALRPRSYEGSIRITCSNGNSVTKKLAINYDEEKHTVDPKLR